jgi:phosphate-selective porin OprO and OprP
LRRIEARYEAMERKHAEQYETLNKRYEAVVESLRRVDVAAPTTPAGSDFVSRPRRDASFEGGAGARDNPIEESRGSALGGLLPESGGTAYRSDTSREGGAGARDNVSEPPTSSRAGRRRMPLNAEFGPGFQFSSDDDEFQLQFHNLTQIDLRYYTQPGQDPVHSGFSIPRQRWYFTGRLTRAFEFYTTINRGFGTLDLYDAFINYRYDDRLMFKVGRFKTPFTYEFYAISAPDMISPERSLFHSNFSPNRQLGLMSWGQLADKRIDYAVGLFNGNRLSFQDTNESKDVVAFLNGRPFETLKDGDALAFLKNLNVGGSTTFGNENNPPLPSVLRTSIAASNAADATNIAPPFLTFNKNVVERGIRSFWNLHLAYFYKGLSLIGEWDTGYQSYATTSSGPTTRVPVNGYYVQAAYLVTGETIDRRTQIDPLRPFNLRKGKFGLGAIEIQGRYSDLALGKNVFTSRLADPNLWSDRLYTIDLGVNWYLSSYTKIVLEWEHAVFGQPVLFAPGRSQLTSDLFWVRFQLYF